MATYNIQHEIGIAATPEAVYAALTKIDQLAKWWTTDTRGNPEPGGVLEFWFGKFCQPFQITALEPGKLVRWKAQSNGMDKWAPTEIIFRLSFDGKQTILRFTHANWEEESDFFAHCSTKWAVFMLSLKDLLEQGKGRPTPDDIHINHN